MSDSSQTPSDAANALAMFDFLLDDVRALSLPEFAFGARVSYVEATAEFCSFADELSRWDLWRLLPLAPAEIDDIKRLYAAIVIFYRDGGEGYKEAQDPRWATIMAAASNVFKAIEKSAEYRAYLESRESP